MRIALAGASGQLGTELQKTLPGEVIPLGHDRLDIADARQVEDVLAAENPEFVVNAAAYNLVDCAEDEPQQAFHVNALGPRNLAAFCETRGIGLLHVSSDYVFSGLPEERGGLIRAQPYTEADPPRPQSAYAVSKLAGEYFVRAACRRQFVVRTCGLYGKTKQPGSGNFVETMLRLGTERDTLNVVNDQRCTPTYCADLAEAIAVLIETDKYGLYHATNAGDVTWYDFAREIFRIAGITVHVEPIPSEQFGAKAARPVYSVLDNGKLQAATGRSLPPWQEALARFLSTRGA